MHENPRRNEEMLQLLSGASKPDEIYAALMYPIVPSAPTMYYRRMPFTSLMNLHRSLWEYLAAYPESQKGDWPYFTENRLIPKPRNICYACEQATNNYLVRYKRMPGKYLEVCELCPVTTWREAYSSMGVPCQSGHEYGEWIDARRTRDIIRIVDLATQIRNLKWSMTREG